MGRCVEQYQRAGSCVGYTEFIIHKQNGPHVLILHRRLPAAIRIGVHFNVQPPAVNPDETLRAGRAVVAAPMPMIVVAKALTISSVLVASTVLIAATNLSALGSPKEQLASVALRPYPSPCLI